MLHFSVFRIPSQPDRPVNHQASRSDLQLLSLSLQPCYLSSQPGITCFCLQLLITQAMRCSQPLVQQQGSFRAAPTTAHRRAVVRSRASSREPKDPARFSDMDEARDYLMQSNGGPIAGALNWLSNAAFGAGKAGAHLGSWYRQWLSQGAAQHR